MNTATLLTTLVEMGALSSEDAVRVRAQVSEADPLRVEAAVVNGGLVEPHDVELAKEFCSEDDTPEARVQTQLQIAKHRAGLLRQQIRGNKELAQAVCASGRRVVVKSTSRQYMAVGPLVAAKEKG